ncbi:MAG: hypothetical protein HRT88_11040 [Lentisphaeraceae bacterium]|nr:hypothetical protein [Lentisphaeraceae bacterium]
MHLFRIKDKEYSLGDLFMFLEKEQLLEFYSSLLHKAYLCRSRADEEGLDADLAELQKCADVFRYKNDLLSVEDLFEWLRQRSLKRVDFEEYVELSYWVEFYPENTAVTNYDFKRDELLRYLYFSGSFETIVFEWQKRLMAWYEKNHVDFKGWRQLSSNYRLYLSNAYEEWDAQSWLRVYKKENFPDENIDGADLLKARVFDVYMDEYWLTLKVKLIDENSYG